MSKPSVLSVAKLSPLLAPQLDAAFDSHVLSGLDASALALLAPTVRGLAGSGDSKVPAELILQLPALEVISVMGVGYDGVDVAAAKDRKSVV